MKFAECNYARFENSVLELKLRKGDIFQVTPEIEKSKVFIESINTKNFALIVVDTPAKVKRVVGLSDKEIAGLIKAYEEKDEADRKVAEELAQKRAEDLEAARRTREPVQPPPELEADDSVPDADEQPPADEKTPPSPDVDGMEYRELQTFALELEKQYKVDINRTAKKSDLVAKIKEVLDKHAGE